MLDILTSPEVTGALMNLLTLVIVGVIGLLTRRVSIFIKAHATAKQMETLGQVAALAVMAAEQMGLAGYIDDKKAAAIAMAENALASKGINVDLDTLEAAIEAAVAENLNRAAINEASYQKAVGGTGA